MLEEQKWKFIVEQAVKMAAEIDNPNGKTRRELRRSIMKDKLKKLKSPFTRPSQETIMIMKAVAVLTGHKFNTKPGTYMHVNWSTIKQLPVFTNHSTLLKAIQELSPGGAQVLLRLKRVTRLIRAIDAGNNEKRPYLVRYLYNMLQQFMATRQAFADERAVKAAPLEETAEEEDDKEDPEESKDDPVEKKDSGAANNAEGGEQPPAE